LAHATEKSLKELGDKVEPKERADIEAALSDLKKVMDSKDKDQIEKKTQALSEVSAKLAERVYAQQGSQEGAAGGAEQAQGNQDDVVDAEFEEVKEGKK